MNEYQAAELCDAIDKLRGAIRRASLLQASAALIAMTGPDHFMPAAEAVKGALGLEGELADALGREILAGQQKE